MDVKIINFDKMSAKEIEKYHTQQTQVLFEMLTSEKYGQRDIDLQKSRVDNIYKQLGKKYKKISKMKG